MQSKFRQICTALSVISLMQISWWGVAVDPNDYHFGVDTQRITAQQINSTNSPKEDLHFLEKNEVDPPIEREEESSN